VGLRSNSVGYASVTGQSVADGGCQFRP